MEEFHPQNQTAQAIKHDAGWIPLKMKHLWLGVPVFLLVCKSFLFPLPLLDFWWHLKLGEIIVQTHAIPRTDIFSFTAAGQPFVVQNWLAEIIYYLIYCAGGFALLIFFNTVLLVGALCAVYRLCRDASPILWPGVVAAGMIAAFVFCNTRPQVFSIVLFAVFYWALASFHSRRRDVIWILPLLMIIWVNLHGAFILGLVLAGGYIVGEIHAYISNRGEHGKKYLTKLTYTWLFCSAVTLINPETYGVYSYVFSVMGNRASQMLVVEWQSPEIASVQGVLLFYLPFYLTALVLICSDRRPALMEIILFTGFSALGLTASRNSVWFLLIAAPIMARHLPLIDWKRWWNPRTRPSCQDYAITSATGKLKLKKEYPTLNAIIAFASLAIISIQSPWFQQGVFNTSLLDPSTPVAAMDYIESNLLDGRIFHPQIYGDYLIWRLWPKQRSFFDGRVHLFDESLVQDYQQMFRGSDWGSLVEKYDIRYLLLHKGRHGADSNRIMKDARESVLWSVVYEDDLSVLFEKAGGTASPVFR